MNPHDPPHDPTPADGPAADDASATPPDAHNVLLHHRYIRDLSFENPGAPAVPRPDDLRLDVSVRVDTRHLDDLHEVALSVTVTARDDDRVSFLVELVYAALFELRNLDQPARQTFLLAEAPRILFPWVDRIIADLARDGGLPTLNLDPPDFHSLHRHHLSSTPPD